MKSLITLFRIEFMLSIREFSGMIFGVIIPVGLMLLLGVLYEDKLAADGSGATLIQQAFPAVITISVCATGLMGIPITLSNYREKKILLRFKVTPTSPVLLLMAQFLNNLVVVVISVFGVWFIAFVFFGYTMIGNVFAFILTFCVVVLSIYSIGMMIASVSKNVNTSNLLASLLYFPMFLLSGATIPYEIMPKGLQYLVSIMPLTHGIKALKGVSLGVSITDYAMTLLILLIVAIICIIIAVKTFRYDY